MEQHGHAIRYTLDAVAGAITVAALAQILPPIAAALSIIWITIQIAEWAWRKLWK